ncbi:MAG: hypothetical protein AVDCRST_MAG89-2169, partial [uncultured Gemmatimonadetes bacterium]
VSLAELRECVQAAARRLRAAGDAAGGALAGAGGRGQPGRHLGERGREARHRRPAHRRGGVAAAPAVRPRATHRGAGQEQRRPLRPPHHRVVRRAPPHLPAPRRRRGHPHRLLGRARGGASRCHPARAAAL